MTKHLTQQDIRRVVDQIGKMRGTITWERVEKAVREKLDLPHSKWSLRERPAIKKKYDARRAELKAAKKATKKAAPKLPPNPAEVIEELQARVHALEGQLAVVLDNAADLGVPFERITRPPNPATYSPTPAGA